MLTFQDYEKARDKERFILSVISEHRFAVETDIARMGREYYRQRNTEILKYKKYIRNLAGAAQEDIFASNNKVASNFFHQFIDQEVQYLLSNGVTLEEGEKARLEAAHNAGLSWSSVGDYDFYAVYRDGKLIAKVTGTSYVDELSIGSVSYMVRGCWDDSDNYGDSGSAAVSVSAPYLMICGVETPGWISLRLSGTQGRSVTVSRSRDVSYVYFSGSAYPSAEISEFQNLAFSFDAAFLTAADAAPFEALLGRLVCVKRGTDMAIGVLAAQECTVKTFYRSYSCTVRQCKHDGAVTL